MVSEWRRGKEGVDEAVVRVETWKGGRRVAGDSQCGESAGSSTSTHVSSPIPPAPPVLFAAAANY